MASQRQDNGYERSAWDKLVLLTIRHQGWLFLPLAVGLAMLPFGLWRLGAPLIGGAFVLSGLIPVMSGVYRSPLYRLKGWPARLRGLVTMALGAFVAALPWTLTL